MYTPHLRYKREALAAHYRLSEDRALDTPRLSQHKLGFTPNHPARNLLRAQAIQYIRTTLNHSKIYLVLAHLLPISMVGVVEHSHHDDDMEMMEGVASSAPYASR